MSLQFFYTDPFDSSSAVVPPDFFTGDGSEDTFPVTDINKVGSTIQYSNTQLYLYLGGFVKNLDNTVTLSETPALDQQGIIPGNTAIVFSSYDKLSVNGVPSPANVDEQSIFLGDFDEINLYGYEPRESNWGIVVSLVDAITAAGPDLTWVQLACTNSAGQALTYAATGEPIHTPALNQFGTISASGTAGNNTLSCSDAADFIPGDYLFLNYGNVTQEVVRYDFRSGNVMTFVTNFNYDHEEGETIFAAFREFKGKQTVPENATNNTAMNSWNIYLNAVATQVRRF